MDEKHGHERNGELVETRVSNNNARAERPPEGARALSI